MNRSPVPGIISSVRPGSLAALAGIEAGDAIALVAKRIPRDVVDFQFLSAEREVEIQVRKANGLDDLIVFEKEIDDDLGVEFEHAAWDDVTLCNNNCFFCFLKGLPRGMRKSLYMKDDDYRLSFLHGNFVTLTNLTEDDWARLEEQRLSPLNVSVHATELELRRKMLSNNSAPDVIAQLRRLGELGIRAHTQIVLCPGVNDGEHLDRSVRDLGALYPTVQSVSIVPVGASPKLEDWSRERDGIELERPNAAYARAIVGQVRRLQREMLQLHGAAVVHCSDEYYVTAGRRVPAARHYDGYPQYENGIGMVRSMLEDWKGVRRRFKAGKFATLKPQRVVVASGRLAAPLLEPLALELSQLSGSEIEVVPVTNTVFGERVNVTGLICGKDYVQQLQAIQTDLFILPRPSLDYFGRKFLDSMTVDELQQALGRSVGYASQWSDVMEILRDGPRRPERNEHSNGAFWSEERRRLPKGAAWVAA
jgi:putative radical SAM enzyme (TIGR03279 family)